MKPIATSLGILLAASSIAWAAACSSSSSSSMPVTLADAASGEVPQVVESCATSDFEDDTGKTSVSVTPWDTSLGKKCIKIKAGTSVSWNASSTHPLVMTGGTTPSPIPPSPATSPQSLTFSAAGVYGYQCSVHLSLMHGAIWVVP